MPHPVCMLRSIGEWGEVERHIIVQETARWPGYRMFCALVDQLWIADAHSVRSLHPAVSAVQAVVQNPRQIIAVDDAPDQRF